MLLTLASPTLDVVELDNVGYIHQSVDGVTVYTKEYPKGILYAKHKIVCVCVSAA